MYNCDTNLQLNLSFLRVAQLLINLVERPCFIRRIRENTQVDNACSVTVDVMYAQFVNTDMIQCQSRNNDGKCETYNSCLVV